jgi:hypothetical protein
VTTLTLKVDLLQHSAQHLSQVISVDGVSFFVVEDFSLLNYSKKEA